MPGPYRPTSELVAQAWVPLAVETILAASVATSLPRDPAAWASTGFVQVQTVANRSVDVDLPRRLPVVQVDTWACNPSGKVPPWGVAAQLAEEIYAAAQYADLGGATEWLGKPIGMPKDNYAQARIWAVYPLTEPVKVLGDELGYARFTIDLAFDWVRV